MTAPNIVLPSKPTNRGAASTGSQRDRRFTDTYRDNHKSARFPSGRPFTGEREQAATPDQTHLPGFISPDLQCGEYFCENPQTGQTREERLLSLESAWSSPWLPVADYWVFNHHRKLISFEYVRGEADERQSLNRYYEAAAKLAGANGWKEIEFGKTPGYQVTALIGFPSPFLPIFQAARAGDPWLLGHIDEPNEELAKILGLQVLFSGPNAERGGLSMRATPVETPKPKGIVTPEAVLATPSTELLAMIADVAAKAAAAAVQAGFDARDKQNRDRMAKARAGKKTGAAA